jgi:hypothetical protein
VSGLLLVTVTYGAYWIAENRGVTEAMEFGFPGYYLQAGSNTVPSITDMLLGPVVFSSAIIASNFLYLYPPVRALLEDLFTGKSLVDETVMGATSPDWLGWIASLTFGSVVIGGGFLLLQLKPGVFLKTVEGKFLLAWIVAYVGIVISGGNPTGFEGWLILLVPFWAFIVGALGGVSVRNGMLLLIAGSLVIHNLVAGLAPLYLGQDRLETTAEWLTENADSNDIVLTADSAVLARYIAYQTPAHVAQVGVGAHPVEDVRLITSLLSEKASTAKIILALKDRGLLAGYRAVPSDQGHVYITRDLFNAPRWLQESRPEVALELEILQRQAGHLFVPLKSTDLYMVRESSP